MEDGSVRRDLDLEMVYLNLVNLLTGGVNFLHSDRRSNTNEDHPLVCGGSFCIM